MIWSERFPGYPASFPVERGSKGRWTMVEGFFATDTPHSSVGDREVAYELPEEGLTVIAGSPSARDDSRPVYSLGQSPRIAVPTGRVFVQGADDSDWERLVAEHGYRIDIRVSYAPRAAWLSATDGTIAGALCNLETFMGQEGLLSAQAQMLMPTHRRSE